MNGKPELTIDDLEIILIASTTHAKFRKPPVEGRFGAFDLLEQIHPVAGNGACEGDR
jgi:hypothetical protein